MFRRTSVVLAAAALLAACAPAEEAEPMPEAAPPAPSLADFAGTWNSSTTLEGVAAPVASTMTLAADGMNSTLSLDQRPNIALTVSMSGDSLVAVTAEYESVLRKGVMVTTRTASVLKDGKMMGNVIATYRTPKGPEVVMGTIEGTRAP